jgi:hypothetical protein
VSPADRGEAWRDRKSGGIVERNRRCLSCGRTFFSCESVTERIKSENPQQAPGSPPSDDANYVCSARELATWMQMSDVVVRKIVPRRAGPYEYRLGDVKKWLATKRVDPAKKRGKKAA